MRWRKRGGVHRTRSGWVEPARQPDELGAVFQIGDEALVQSRGGVQLDQVFKKGGRSENAVKGAQHGALDAKLLRVRRRRDVRIRNARVVGAEEAASGQRFQKLLLFDDRRALFRVPSTCLVQVLGDVVERSTPHFGTALGTLEPAKLLLAVEERRQVDSGEQEVVDFDSVGSRHARPRVVLLLVVPHALLSRLALFSLVGGCASSQNALGRHGEAREEKRDE